jgi:HEPN domain-containing protein
LGPDLNPAVLAEVRESLHKAAEDVRTAEVSYAPRPPLFDAAAFHCQQAAEKAIKGFLTFHARVFEKTHSIEKIGAAALAVDPTLRAAIDRATPLTEYAWKFRYPGTPGEPSAAEVGEAMEAARELLLEIIRRVPGTARP